MLRKNIEKIRKKYQNRNLRKKVSGEQHKKLLFGKNSIDLLKKKIKIASNKNINNYDLLFTSPILLILTKDTKF